MAPKQCYFYLRGHTQFLGSLGAGLFGAVCAFSEECSFQWRLLLLQFSVDSQRHAACLLFVHTCCVCILGAVHACFVYRLAAHTSLLCMHGYCVCANAMYAQLLCVHTCYVCMLEVVYACLRVRNSRTHSLVPCGVGEEHWAGLYVHPPRRCLCITDVDVTQCSQAQFGDCLHKTLDPFWFK